MTGCAKTLRSLNLAGMKLMASLGHVESAALVVTGESGDFTRTRDRNSN